MTKHKGGRERSEDSARDPNAAGMAALSALAIAYVALLFVFGGVGAWLAPEIPGPFPSLVRGVALFLGLALASGIILGGMRLVRMVIDHSHEIIVGGVALVLCAGVGAGGWFWLPKQDSAAVTAGASRVSAAAAPDLAQERPDRARRRRH